MKILNTTQNTVLAEHAAVADSFWSRLRGLIGRPRLEGGQALIITRCNSIHMLFMTYALDVVFVDRNDTVVGLASDIPPFAFSRVYFRAVKAVELPTGAIALSRTSLNDRLVFA